MNEGKEIGWKYEKNTRYEGRSETKRRRSGLSRGVRKYNLHSQVAQLLSAADVRNHIRSLLFNHTPILYRARLFIAFFPPLNGFLQYFGGSFLFIRSVIELFRFISQALLCSFSSVLECRIHLHSLNGISIRVILAYLKNTKHGD